MLFKNPFTNAGRAQPTPPAPKNPQDNIEPISGVIPENKGTPQPNKKTTEGHDSLMDFEKLWQPNLDKDGKVIAKPGPKRFTPQIDAKVFAQMLEKTDFTKTLTPADFEGVKKGGDEAVQSMLTVLNKVAKSA